MVWVFAILVRALVAVFVAVSQTRGRRRVLASGSTLTTMAGKGLQMTVIRSST
ncbi:uncharacterized protein RCO7_14163 [Rhynchosporium graminicola]|uniref:Uncharacterized protein n=1 Tax=Rhynchosporium graminicola TaxID=2792576 RepID=A0A1E1JVE7_9HELO|nr:uncharacterized protein RCO7_14163 [Rhynchosporium commune]